MTGFEGVCIELSSESRSFCLTLDHPEQLSHPVFLQVLLILDGTMQNCMLTIFIARSPTAWTLENANRRRSRFILKPLDVDHGAAASAL